MLDRYFRRKQFRVLASRCSFGRFWLPRPRLLQCGNTQCSKHPVVSSFLQQDSSPTEWFCNQRPQLLSTCDISIQLIQWVVASRTQQPALPRSSCETAPYAQFSLPGSLAVCCHMTLQETSLLSMSQGSEPFQLDLLLSLGLFFGCLPQPQRHWLILTLPFLHSLDSFQWLSL